MLTVSYDGTNYCGWQIQPTGITVEEVLNKALSKRLGEDIRVKGVSRTDSGVHARGNLCVFDTETPIPPEKVCFVHCKTPPHCPRKKRPIQCRTFPLTPYLNKKGELSLVYNDMDLPYRCPLIEEELPLNDDFVQATETVWRHLVRDKRIYDMVKEDSDARDEAIAQLAGMLGF